jgi:hypothetical protein
MVDNLVEETGEDREKVEEIVDVAFEEGLTNNQVGNNQLPSYPNQSMVYSNQLPSYSNQSTVYSNQLPSYSNQSTVYSNQPTVYPNQPTFLNKFLAKPEFVSNQIKTYTIEKGINLYYASNNKKGFNPGNIQLGNDNLISFFTPNFKLASDRIGGCDINNPNGYIHAFEVVREIPNIYVKLPYDTDYDYTLKSLYDKFCAGSTQYNGVGFFYPKNEIEVFSNVLTNQNPNQNPNPNPNSNYQNQGFQSLPEGNFYSEFGICNPTPYLKYLYSCKCQGLRQLSSPYQIDKGFQ